jgi:hypothetical protein
VLNNKIFIPSKRFAYILGSVLLFILVMALPGLFGKMFSFGSLEPEMRIAFGWPVSFFEYDIINMVVSSLDWLILIISLLCYLVVSYGLDIFFSFILSVLKGPEKLEDIMIQARKAYFYYKGQGLEDSKIHEMFKQKGWKDEDIDKLK